MSADVGDDDDILNIDWEDLEDVPEEGLYPAIEPGASREQALGLSPGGVEVPCACSASGRQFAVRFEQVADDQYQIAEVIERQGQAAGQIPQGPQVQIDGRFGLTGYRGCPYCGGKRLAVCDQCGVAMCYDKTGKGTSSKGRVTCPVCGASGSLAGETHAVRIKGGKKK